MSEVQQKITIQLPTSFSASDRAQAGKLLIKLIRARTDKGLDASGSPFTKYSDSYKGSKDFAIGGKTSTVNLKLSGEMMRSIEVLGSSVGFVTIGFEANTEANDRASFAGDFANGPVREFLGVSRIEIQQVVDAIKADTLGANVRGLLQSDNFSILDFLRIT